jgi:hypothetical protein
LKIRKCSVLLLCILAVDCAPLDPPVRVTRPTATHQPRPRPTFSKRPAKPDLIRLKNGHYRLKSAWTVELNGRRWTVQKGYKSNGITCPSWMKSSLGDGVKYPETWAAVFHDWLFTQPGVSRSQADNLFYDLLIAYGVPDRKAKLMHTTVTAYSVSKRFE